MPGAGATPPPDELRSVAGYHLLRQVGEGGMSTVYLGYDVPAGRHVAVKVLADHLAGRREFVERFYREARNSQRLHHPNLVHGHAAGFDPATGKHFLVMEYVDGPSAQAALARAGRLPVGVAVRIGIDVATALRHLHTRDYVHRDVKPDNILLPPGGPAKLADLGLTKRLSGDGHLTAVSEGVGTTYYMPYEQAMNAALVDGRSDIFALGATLYHLLTGHVPFPGASHEEVIRGKEQGAYRPVRSAAPGIPPVLGAIITRALSRDPRERFQDAAAFAAALESTGLATDIPAFPTGPGGGTGTDQPPDAPTRADLPAVAVPAAAALSPGGDRRHSATGPLLGLAAVAAVVTGGVIGFRPAPQPPAPPAATPGQPVPAPARTPPADSRPVPATTTRVGFVAEDAWPLIPPRPQPAPAWSWRPSSGASEASSSASSASRPRSGSKHPVSVHSKSPSTGASSAD